MASLLLPDVLLVTVWLLLLLERVMGVGDAWDPPPQGRGEPPMALRVVQPPPASWWLSPLGWRDAGDPQGSLERNPPRQACCFPTGSECPAQSGWTLEAEGSCFLGHLYLLSIAEIGGGGTSPRSPCRRLTQSGSSSFLPVRRDGSGAGWCRGWNCPAWGQGLYEGMVTQCFQGHTPHT